MIFIRHWLESIFISRHARLAKSRVSNPYHCVTIRYPGDQACEAVQKLEPKSRLSGRVPLFLETHKRYLSSEAPLLPLPGCTASYCQCRYVHYEDRRELNRRHLHQEQQTAFIPASVGRERRSGTDRRRNSNIQAAGH